ncbi:membrane protein [Ornithinimicrobium tianjinense]|uniref:Membrane protein n=1 Tax=Ornithinimicrobium tianjinense TaxID=1195761 RepID=A0A917F1J8_9MICO|nr:membrane protein [Ornithinimicrobium tianjinense]
MGGEREGIGQGGERWGIGQGGERGRTAQAASTGGRQLDGRLLVPALTAWAALVALLPRSSATCLVVGVASLSAAAAMVLWRRTPRSPPRHRARPGGTDLRGVVALTLAATGLVATSTATHLATDRAGPVAGWAAEGAVVSASAVVTGEPRVVTRGDEREPLVVVHLRLLRVEGRGSGADVSTPVLLLTAAGEGWEELGWRQRLSLTGRLRPAEDGERHVAVLSPVGGPREVTATGGLLRGIEHVRSRFREAVDPLPADARGLVPGLVIGDTSLTPEDLTEAMRATGMTHLSAVSGSNVALVCGALAVLVARAGVGRQWRTPLVLVGLAGFVLLCRPEPSVLRAAVMGSVGLLALSSGRRRVSLPALAVAVVGLLCVDPWLARSYGFALSTLATLGLVLWSRPWGDAISARLPARWRLLGDALAVPLAAQVACAPVIVLLQGSITVVAVLANLLAAPLVAPTTVLGVVAAVLAPLSVTLARAVAWAAAVPAWLLGRVARTFAPVPWGTVDWVDGAAGAWLLTVLTVICLVTGPWWRHQLRRHPSWGWAAGLGALALVWPVPRLSAWPPPDWVVIGCDVGQGDAVLLRSGPSSAVLVDAGPEPDALRRCLRAADVSHLDAVVLSHFHADHVVGLPGALAVAGADAAFISPVREPAETSARTLDVLAADGVPVGELRAGDVVTAGALTLEVLSPGPHPVVGESAANNGSLVVDARVAGIAVLLSGDIEPEGARPLRAALAGRDFDVLKVAHHGSARQDEALVRGTRAEVALMGVGADNDFGHPAPRTLELLRSAGMVVLRTDTDGDVAVSGQRGRLLVHKDP